MTLRPLSHFKGQGLIYVSSLGKHVYLEKGGVGGVHPFLSKQKHF